MHRLLERLDGAASTLVPLLYLCGLALGTVAYFSGVRLALDGVLVGGALALAAEMHSYLEQRRVRAVWAQLARLPDDDDHRDALTTQLRAHGAILAILVLFSSFNSVAFVAATWTPTPGFLPDWLQIGLRGAIVPIFFLLTGALSPLSTDAGAVLQAASRDMLHRAIRATTRQWRTRLRAASARKLDLAPVAIALMEDAGDADGARRIRLIAQGLATAEHPQTLTERTADYTAEQAMEAVRRNLSITYPPAIDERDEREEPEEPTPEPQPPTDGGSPSVASKRTSDLSPASGDVASNVTPITRRGLGRAPRRDRRAANRANARSGRRGTAEARIRAVVAQEPGVSHAEVVRRTGVSSSTVSKWRQVIEAERRSVAQAQ